MPCGAFCVWGSGYRSRSYRRAVKVYRSPDRAWRIEVRDTGWVHVTWRTMPMGRFASLREAADYLVGQGITELVED